MGRRILSRAEVGFYFCCWIFGITYSTYRIYLIGNDQDENLVKGWLILNRQKDAGDREWTLWTEFIFKSLGPWIILNYIGAYVVNYINLKFLPLWYLVLTSSFVISNYGLDSLLIFLMQPLLFAALLYARKSPVLLFLLFESLYCICIHEEIIDYLGKSKEHREALFNFSNYGLDWYLIFLVQPSVIITVSYHRKSKFLIWILYCLLYHLFVYKEIIMFPVSSEDLGIIIPTIMWIYLRCLSFCLDEIENELTLFNLYSFLGYVFYLPCFSLGPILCYKTFLRKMYVPREYSRKSVYYLFFNNIRYFFWMFVTEFLLHFIYINHLLKDIKLVTTAEYSLWIMYGIGFSIGQFFFLKYTVAYGLTLTWTKTEGYDTPDPPKCIARISLYSDMWRLFDEGLYIFIRRYIYEPGRKFLSTNIFSHLFVHYYANLFSKVFSSVFCFIFVFVWHGVEYWVFIWALLNFCGIMLEMLAREISKSTFYSNFKNSLGPRHERRFIALVCAPLTILSAISNFYFLEGPAVAEAYFDYIFMSGVLSNTLCLWFFVYCLCQVSMEVASPKKIKN